MVQLSIIIPAYNVEKHIVTTLRSLINQTDRQFEVIIVDDGSTDNTLKIVEDIMAEGKIANYKIIQKDNGGVSSARNRGLNESLGQYVLFLDGDDYIASNFVETVCKYINNQEYDVICWAFNLVTEDKKTIQNYFDKYSSELKNMTGIDVLNNILNNKNMWIWTGSAIYRREFLLKYDLKYTEGCINAEDLEFTFKTLSRAKNIIFINKVLSYYVQRPDSITQNYNIKKFDAVYAKKRIFEYFNSIDRYEFKKISNIIKEEWITLSYLANFSFSLRFLRQKGYSHKECINVLINEIDKNYPGLRQEMLSMMKNYKGKDFKLLLKIKAFLISPFFYNFLWDVKVKINKARSYRKQVLRK